MMLYFGLVLLLRDFVLRHCHISLQYWCFLEKLDDFSEMMTSHDPSLINFYLGSDMGLATIQENLCLALHFL